MHTGIFNPGRADEAGGSPVQIKTYWTEWREANELLVYSPGLVLWEWNLSWAAVGFAKRQVLSSILARGAAID